MEGTKTNDDTNSCSKVHPHDNVLDVVGDVEAVADRVEDRTDEEKALVRKIDLALMPIIWVMYLFSYADRT